MTKPFTVEAFLDCVTRILELPPAAAGDAEPDWNLVLRQWELTPRQGEVLVAFYRTGRSNQQLAEDLAVSPHTIKSHVQVAFQRAGVRTRGQLLQRLRAFIR
ncbi:MAG: hypothetical protein CVT65_18575 [Actinobacteria bacterium HGW-Actinobacteria-5]|nr:MAG: hypothetical protein CVT65_18575 [Actinobacteria bacterium HGW-Actinobacteria-5]